MSPPGSFNNDIGLPLTVLTADEQTRVPGAGDGRPRPRAHRPALPRSPARRSAWCSTSARRTSASSAAPRASPSPRASSSRRCPTDGTAVLNADDPRVIGMAPRTAARVVTTGRGADADVRAADVALDDAGPRPVHPGRRRARSTRSTLQVVGEHQVANALSAAGAPRWPPGMTPAAVAAALSAAGAAQPLADGGVPPRRRRHRRQRRLQRQPRVDAGRAGRARRAVRHAGGSPSWAPWPSWAPTPPPSTSGWAGTPRRPGST